MAAAPVLALGGAGAARAEALICTDSASAPIQNSFRAPGATGIRILRWEETVCLEHNDRVRRLRALTDLLPPDARPQFSEFLVPRDRLPPGFPVGMPLLRVVFPEQSFFDTASSRIKPEALIALTVIASSLRREVPDVAVFVAGHTDSRGGEDYNHNLSVDRAESVAQRLRSLGIGEVALWRVGFGESVPLQANDSDRGMAVNRRVEFLFGPRAEPVAAWLAEQRAISCADPGHGAPGQCKRPLKRREFEAVALTSRTGLSVPAASRSARRIETDRRAPVQLALARQREGVAVPQRPRLILDLNASKVRIPAPVR
jgi:outer membrane protein OmpA-like peptidoglycan-associated protein